MKASNWDVEIVFFFSILRKLCKFYSLLESFKAFVLMLQSFEITFAANDSGSSTKRKKKIATKSAAKKSLMKQSTWKKERFKISERYFSKFRSQCAWFWGWKDVHVMKWSYIEARDAPSKDSARFDRAASKIDSTKTCSRNRLHRNGMQKWSKQFQCPKMFAQNLETRH